MKPITAARDCGVEVRFSDVDVSDQCAFDIETGIIAFGNQGDYCVSIYTTVESPKRVRKVAQWKRERNTYGNKRSHP